MAFAPGTNTRYYVGSMRFSAFGKSLTADATVNQLDTSTFETKAITYLNGQKTATASLEMMLDTAYAAQSQFAILNTWKTTPQPVTIGFYGVAALDVVWMLDGNQSTASIGSSVGDLVTANVSVQANSGIDWGYVIAPEAAITEDGNGTARDLTASSSNGGVAHLHSTAFAGLDSNDIIIEQSANGTSNWSTLVTFAQVTGVGSQRIVVAPGTAVARYLRVVDDVTGTGSHTRIVTFSRR